MNGLPPLTILPITYSVCQLAADAAIPAGMEGAAFWSVVRTPEELSLVVPDSLVRPDWPAQPGWRCIQVVGPLDFSLTGVLAGISAPLAQAGISIFVVSTYNTDYIFIPGREVGRARRVLEEAGYPFQ